MTREEAIQELQNCKGLIQQDGQDYLDERDIPLLDMAIEALSVAELKSNFESADAVDVYKAHEEEHLNIINRIKELQYAILGEKHQRSHGRLIDADELKKHLDGAWEELNDDGERKGVRLARWYLISAPTVDTTIDVVRCKDCRHRDLFSCPLADNDFQKDDDFCSWGERREE